MKQTVFVDTPDGRVSMWDLLSYVQANPELAALAQRDINLAVPLEGLTRYEPSGGRLAGRVGVGGSGLRGWVQRRATHTHTDPPVPHAVLSTPHREERLAKLVELAPWRLCSGERRMVLPDAVAAKLPWGLLAGSTWWSRRPSRWLKVRRGRLGGRAHRHMRSDEHEPGCSKLVCRVVEPRHTHAPRPRCTPQGLDGRADFVYGLYAHEAAAAALLGPRWGGRNPQAVLADKAFYREALGHAPSLGMSLLAVASRPLPLQELTQ
jgi:hypothetical protein